MNRVAAIAGMMAGLSVLVSAPAGAQPPLREPTHPDRRFSLWIDAPFFFGDVGGINNLITVAPELGFAVRVARPVELIVRWGFSAATADLPRGDDDGAQFANPFVGANYVRERGARLLRNGTFSFRAGGGIALPLADIDNGGDALAFLGAIGTRGAWDPWLWTPDRLSFVGYTQLDGHAKAFVWGVDAALGLMFDTGEDADGTGVGFETAVELGGMIGNRWTLGGRLQMVLVSTDQPFLDDFTQFALEPFVRWTNGKGFFRMGLLLNLDEPLGFAFDDTGMYGLKIGGGVRL